MDSSISKHRILMFPWLAHGHITPFLELAKKLIKRNFVVNICTTQVNINAFKPKLEEYDSSQLIQFVELHLPSLPDLPPNYHTTKSLPPNLMNTLLKALHMAKDDFHRILHTLKPDLLIYDGFQLWAPQLASPLNIPSAFFSTSSASVICFLAFLVKKPGEEFPFPEIFPQLKLPTRDDTQQAESASAGLMHNLIDSIETSTDVILINSFNNIESKFTEFIRVLLNKKVIPVGPLVQALPSTDDEKTKSIIEWIEKKEQDSVLYVSFGSECYLTDEEIEAVAKGLELSNVNFIWVLRFPEGAKKSLEEALPDGFLKRVEERGLIVEDWAPQARILAHPNTGGFVTHCGWNSLLESMTFGVPVVAYPMHLDQPLNARLIEEIGCGIEVARDEDGKWKEGELARVIKEVMVEKSGEHVRIKAKELKDIIGKILEEENEIDEAVYALAKPRVFDAIKKVEETKETNEVVQDFVQRQGITKKILEEEKDINELEQEHQDITRKLKKEKNNDKAAVQQHQDIL